MSIIDLFDEEYQLDLAVLRAENERLRAENDFLKDVVAGRVTLSIEEHAKIQGVRPIADVADLRILGEAAEALEGKRV